METNTFKVRGRWCWTADHARLVPETSTEAAYLAYFDGQEIADTEAKRVGLLGTDEVKQVAEPLNKMRRPRENK